jgi:hypothetical protein
MNVLVMSFNDLPDDVKDEQPDNGSGKEYASYLRVKYHGQEPVYYSDAMEAEDARFYRDLSWIKDALLEAYRQGKSGN